MSQDPMGDIPLFREIQKLLSSSHGPINLEIARQVAAAMNQDSTDTLDTAAARTLAEAVRNAEFMVSGYTQRAVDEPALSEMISPRQWIAATMSGWEWLLTHLATRFSSEVTSFSSERGDEVDPMGSVMGQIAPLLLGMQAGTLVGQLARDAMGRYDPAIPRRDDGHLFFVGTTIDRVAGEYDFEPDPFRRWLALEDVARHTIVGSASWVEKYRRSLFVELVDSIEIDASDLERRLADLQHRGREALEEGFDPSEMLPIVQTPRHTKALGNLRAFIAVFEGYARHVSSAVGAEAVGDTGRIAEGMRRRSASPNEGRTMLNAMLGWTPDPGLEQTGTTFCNAIVELHGIGTLNLAWAAPDNLPTITEVRDPFQWIERVVEQ